MGQAYNCGTCTSPQKAAVEICQHECGFGTSGRELARGQSISLHRRESVVAGDVILGIGWTRCPSLHFYVVNLDMKGNMLGEYNDSIAPECMRISSDLSFRPAGVPAPCIHIEFLSQYLNELTNMQLALCLGWETVPVHVFMVAWKKASIICYYDSMKDNSFRPSGDGVVLATLLCYEGDWRITAQLQMYKKVQLPNLLRMLTRSKNEDMQIAARWQVTDYR
eukprot:GEMP01021384.1.p1 GENE.GEMP01021384.1~~GEMP01021384.1.p1  ORF type:complete len:222 (+),score=45.41 GEMP01021384.1:251-916(+)